ncbi:MAG: hypothetical protein CVV02_04775 [Firmicutes bacterium HGW-Firmicutes-7]|nr:MAG: hypothetical protein CVV02_04775 [Firmicutes bacterium HGW-Firmicutes-7]
MKWEKKLFSRIKEINSDRSLYDYGGGAPLSKCYIMAYLASHFKMENYVEIGAYKGRCLFSVGQAFKDNNGKAYGIDPYSLAEAKEYDLEENLKIMVNNFLEGVDFEAMYNTVLVNKEKYGLSQVVEIIRKTSALAVSDFKDIGIDMLHIDGNHDRKCVQADITNYTPLVNEGGIIILDAIDWESVKSCYDTMKNDYILLLETSHFGILMKQEKTQKNIDHAALLAKKLNNLHLNLLEIENMTTQEKPTVNVGVLAYNHEKYIVECLSSILKQKGDFNLNVIICEDLSTDQTPNIIENYINDTVLGENITIKYLKSNVNLGMVKNLKRLLEACRGSKYTALIDGDDFWVNENKIQTHIEFMENHPECALSFDSLVIYYEDDEKYEMYTMQQEAKGNIFTTPYILLRYIIGNISCGFYLGKYLDQIPDQLFEMFVGDWMLNIYYSQFGDMGYIRTPMTLYRKHSKGIWSGMDAYARNLKTIECIDDYNKYLNFTYDDEFSVTRHGFAHRTDERYLEAYDLVIIDDVFPNPEKEYQYTELLNYLQNINSIKILRMCPYDDEMENEKVNALLINFKRHFPQYGNKLAKFIALDYINCKLLYFSSLENAVTNVALAEYRETPFVFTFTLINALDLYINNHNYDQILETIFQSPYFKKVIVNQAVVLGYLLSKNLCKLEQIEYINEGIAPIDSKIKFLKETLQ